MKKHLIRIICMTFTVLFLSVIVMPPSVYATTDTNCYNWYTKRNKNHTVPILDGSLSVIKLYNAFYVNEKAAKNGDKVVYLTFDAGYENGNIEKILDVLKAHGVASAFFILENLIKRNTDLIKRMADEGHLLCNHTCKHLNMTKITNIDAFAKELSDLEDVLYQYTGLQISKFYRPPEGKFSEQNLAFATELGYTTVFWSFAYSDWDNNKQPDQKAAINLILDNIHNGEIILLHPTSATNAAILDTVIVQLKEQGYRFGSLTELI